ncbi:hypothetical protein [Halomarina rubra]|uniref:Polysaccharide deacetylase n=1 Tax=Halomarina rubra TaxID=2071873 RepID=A0ABD6AYM4_9EURY|nr:hypothetical protein [Halomarina rubra]
MAPNDTVRRRAFLGTVGAAFVGLAGCSDSTGPSNGTDTGTPGTPTATPAGTPNDTTDATPTDSPNGTDTGTPADQGPPAWMANQGDLYDNFAMFDDQWSVRNGSATLVEGEGFMGTPGVRMETDDGGLVRVERKYWQAQDFSNKTLSMAVKLEETTVSSAEIAIYLKDINGNEEKHSDEIPSEAAGEWLRIDPGAKSTDTIDLSQLTHIRIDHYARDGNSTTFVASDLRTHPKPETGTVVFALEGTHENNVDVVYPAMKEAGFAGGVFAAPDKLGHSSDPTISDYQEMVADGWDMGVTTLGAKRLTEIQGEQDALAGATTQLEKRGFDGATNVFRPPRGDYTAETLGYADESFDLTFVGVGGSMGTNDQLTDTRTVLSIDADDLEWATECVEAAATHKQTAVLFFTPRHIDDPAAFEALVARTKELQQNGDLQVVTPTELASRYA